MSTPASKRKATVLDACHAGDPSTQKTAKRRADLTVSTQVQAAIRDNLKPPLWTSWLIYGKLVEGSRGRAEESPPPGVQ
eukprot:4177436-Amphidinium_carterae.1